MRFRRAALIAALAATALPAQAGAATIIVKRAPGLDRAERLAVRRDADVDFKAALKLSDTELVTAADVSGAVDALNANPDVVYAEPDRQLAPASNDTWFGYEWGLENTGQADFAGDIGTPDADIDAPEAWTQTKGAGATVAVVDTGIETTQSDLAGQLTGNPGEQGGGRETNGIDDDGNGYIDDWQGWDFVNGDNTVETQASGHGTHVAGTIAAAGDNAVGVIGVAPEAKVLPVKVFGAPNTTASTSTIAAAFDYAGALGVRVVNASLGGDGFSPTLTSVMLAHPDTLYVVAAGNEGADAGQFQPCNSTAANLICVGASDNADEPASFSNASATAVDLFAPGVSIVSTYLSNGYAAMDGTSMATPHVAGTAALLVASDPGATTAQIKTALMHSVDAPPDLAGLSVTGGRLNAASALDALAHPAPSPTPTPTPTPSPTVTPEPPPAPTATPAPPAPAPVVTPAPTAAPAPLRGLRLSGTVLRGAGRLKATVTMSAAARVTFSVRKGRCTNGRTGCASGQVTGWTKATAAGTSTVIVTRRLRGRTLARGRYTLTASAAGAVRAVAFSVR